LNEFGGNNTKKSMKCCSVFCCYLSKIRFSAFRLPE